MADPLRNDLRDMGPRTSAPVGTGLEEKGNINLASARPLEVTVMREGIDPERELPEPGNHRLNRTAKQIGGTLGKVVSQAQRAPGSARRRLHLVRDRAQEAGANASSSASSLADTAQQRARAVTEGAQQRGAELLDAAEARGRVLLDKADTLGRDVAERAKHVKHQVADRSREFQQAARLRAQEARIKARHVVSERPLHVLGGIAAAAFITGVSLRIVRSQNASRH